jgi:hypothetical protein
MMDSLELRRRSFLKLNGIHRRVPWKKPGECWNVGTVKTWKLLQRAAAYFRGRL